MPMPALLNMDHVVISLGSVSTPWVIWSTVNMSPLTAERFARDDAPLKFLRPPEFEPELKL